MPSARTSWVGAALTLVAALAVAACYPRFEAAPTGTAAETAALAGEWQSQDGEDPRITMVVAVGESRGTVSIRIHDTDDAPAKDDLMLGGELIDSGGVTYAAVRDTNDPGDLGVMLFRVARDGDALAVMPVSDTKITDAIRSGALAGEVRGDGPGAEITVIATADELTAFLASRAGADAFAGPVENVLHFKRTNSAH